MKRFAPSSSFLLVIVCALFVGSQCLADEPPRGELQIKAETEPKDVSVDFVMSTKFASKESYMLLIPQDVIDEAAGRAKTSSITKIKTVFAGIAISLAVLSLLILMRSRHASRSYGRATVAATIIAVLLFGSMQFAIGDVAPIEPPPVEDKITVKIVKGGDAVELIHQVRAPKNRNRGRELREPVDGSSPDSAKR